MKKDIAFHKVEEIAISVVPRIDEATDEELWDTFILNLKDKPIHNVLVCSKGYGEIEGEQIETTTLRHFFDEIGPNKAILIEPIQKKLFEITNEYWVSFSLGSYMYDKKYVFVRGSINNSNFTQIPYINRKGVMIR